MSKGQFKKGDDSRRAMGRPKGSPNRNKLDKAMDDVTKLTPKAVQKLEDILDSKLAGTTPNQVLQAALKVLEIASKYESDKESKEEDSDKGAKEDSYEAPRISLTASK